MNINNVAVLGLQWGDEGKGKIVDLFAKDFDIIMRFQGGNNAGHTVIINCNKYKLSIIPSGIFQKKTCFIGSGVVVSPLKLQDEILYLKDLGFDVTNYLYIADNASVIFDIHLKHDALSERAKGDKKIGTTLRGIGPCYEDRVSRNAIRVCDLFETKELLELKLKSIIKKYNLFARHYGEEILDEDNLDSIFEEIEKYKSILLPYMVNPYEFFYISNNINKRILFEGAQGLLLDVLHGTYPNVTSSSTFAGQISLGSTVAPNKIGSIIGVLKAYITRVGSGIFPTEDFGVDGDYMGEKGFEFGTVTGRKRRCGWLDLVLAKMMVKMNGINSIAITKLDVLSGLKKIKVCTYYKYCDKIISYLPSDESSQKLIEPIYEEFDGWDDDISGVTELSKLPIEAQKYIQFIEKFLETKIMLVSTGPERDENIII